MGDTRISFHTRRYAEWGGLVLTPPTPLIQDITSGLTGWWKFDEGSGTTAADSSGNGYDGTLSGSSLPTWVAGHIGSGALQFNGPTDSYIDVGTGYVGITDGSAAMTLAAWVYVVSPYSAVIGKNNNGNNGDWYLKVRSGPLFQLVVNISGSVTSFDSANILSTSTWYHVAATYDGDKMRIYVNGSIDATSSSVPGTISVDSFPWHVFIGRDLPASTYSGSTLDDIRVYNRALTAAQVAALYAYT